jgi:hypothetical protein
MAKMVAAVSNRKIACGTDAATPETRQDDPVS